MNTDICKLYIYIWRSIYFCSLYFLRLKFSLAYVTKLHVSAHTLYFSCTCWCSNFYSHLNSMPSCRLNANKWGWGQRKQNKKAKKKTTISSSLFSKIFKVNTSYMLHCYIKAQIFKQRGLNLFFHWVCS